MLRALVGSGLLVEADADVFGFRHDLAREAIEGRLLGRERRRIHEAALEALRRTGSSDLAAMARHAHGAGDTTSWSTWPEGAEHYLAIGSSYQALGLAELGLCPRPTATWTSAVGAARAAWLAGLHDDAARPPARGRRRPGRGPRAPGRGAAGC